MADSKREIAEAFNLGHYDEARAKLIELKKSWEADSRWADAFMGAINAMSPPAASK